jgi:hypothetical protein
MERATALPKISNADHPHLRMSRVQILALYIEVLFSGKVRHGSGRLNARTMKAAIAPTNPPPLTS